MTGRPIPGMPSPSTVPPTKSVRVDTQRGNKIGSQKTQPLEKHPLNAKIKFQAEPKLENTSHNLKNTTKTQTKLHDMKSEPSNIFKPFSHSRLKLRRENSNSSDQPTSEADDTDSVRK
jgi:hypothetical protein